MTASRRKIPCIAMTRGRPCKAGRCRGELCAAHEQARKNGRRVDLQGGKSINPNGDTPAEYLNKRLHKEHQEYFKPTHVKFDPVDPAPVYIRVVAEAVSRLGDIRMARAELKLAEDVFIERLRIAREEFGL